MSHVNAGTIQFRNEERVEFSHIIRSKYVGAYLTCPLSVLLTLSFCITNLGLTVWLMVQASLVVRTLQQSHPLVQIRLSHRCPASGTCDYRRLSRSLSAASLEHGHVLVP